MEFSREIEGYYVRPERTLRLSYNELTKYNLDLGFVSELKDGKDFHKITRDIVISVQHYHNKSVTNLLLSEGQPIRVELTDAELYPYYSDYIELRYILSGKLEVEIEGQKVFFYENEICFMNPLTYHRESVENSECLFVNINIRHEMFTEDFLSNIGVSPLQRFLRMNIMKIGEKQHYLKFSPSSSWEGTLIPSYITTIFFEVKNHCPGYVDICKGYVIRLMDDLSRGYDYNFGEKDREELNQKMFESVTEFMQKNLDTVRQQDLAEEFHFHANYFNNLIRKHTGLSYSEFLVRLRMEKARELLDMSQLSIEEIMWLVGYNNKGFFYGKFKEYTGMTPAQYRKN